MAKLCGIRVERVHPEDKVRSLLELQCDAGYVTDFVFELEQRLDHPILILNKRNRRFYIPEIDCTFGAWLRELANVWQHSGTVLVRLDLDRLANPTWAMRHELPDLLFECSGGLIRNHGYGASGDGKALILYLRAERLVEALACIKEVIEHCRIFDNDLRSGVLVAVQRPGGYDVVYPPGFVGTFPI
jgi:hypothetical protein